MNRKTRSGENKTSIEEVKNQEILNVFDHADDPVLSVEEIAGELPIDKGSVSYRLENMEQGGLLGSKKIGEHSVVWWVEPVPESTEESNETSEASGGEEGDPPTETTNLSRDKPTIVSDNENLREVIDLLPDPLYIKNLDDEVLLSNEANAELHGMTPEEMEGKRELDIESDVDNIEDFDKYRRREIEVVEKDEPITLEEDLTGPEGDKHTFRITRMPFEGTTGNEDAILGYARDVTEMKQRERELKWERQLNRSIQEEAVTSRSRDGLEQEVISQLQSHGYEMAWVAESTGDALIPHTLGEDSRYIEDIDWTLGSNKHHSEPCVQASRKGTPQFEQSVEDRSDDWCEVAGKYSYRSCAAIPLVHDEITYGVLAVYHEDPNRFDSLEKQMLEKVADTVGFAIHALETKASLSADHPLNVTLNVGDGYYLTDLARDGVFVDHEEVTVLGTVPIEQGKATQYLKVNAESVPSLQENLAVHPDVKDTAVVGDREKLRLNLTGNTPELELTSHNAVVKETTVEDKTAVIQVKLPKREKLRPVVESLKDRFGDVSVQSVREHRDNSTTGNEGSGEPNLTEKQLGVVRAAYYSGYFAQPRDSSAVEVAESLDVSHSTFLRHLRSAQQKIFRERLDGQQ
jgi:PAS domain S-box-containing protein